MISSIYQHVVSQIGELEIYTGIVVVAMIIVWIVGSITNRSIAESNFKKLESGLSSQFCEPGSLSKESNSHFFVYSTGRSRCSGMLTSLHLSPRQDFISRFVLSWAWKSWWNPDRVEIEVIDSDIDAHVTGLVTRKYLSSKMSEKFNIAKFFKPANIVLENGSLAASATGSLTGFTYICDAGGRAVGESLFGKNSRTCPNFFAQNLKSIYLSGEAKSIKIELSNIPKSETDWKETFDYILFGLLDTLASIKVSENVRTEVMGQRKQEAERQAKSQQEESKPKKTMTQAEIEKMNEKRRKKDLKRGRIIM